jgi:N,N'-diacetyllegionaminate synthase
MINFGSRMVGNGQPIFITFEAGPTHDGMASAKELITLAAESGGDAIKFQILDPDRLISDKKQLFTYEILVDKDSGRMEKVSEPLYDIMCRRALSKSEWKEVKEHADNSGISFFATVGFPEEVDMMEEFNCDSIKIASADITHFPLIRKAARTGMCLQIDTGNSTMGEIEAAVEIIRREGNENIIIHHCPTDYPATITGINLNIISTLKHMFDYPIAFSDHSPGHDMDIAAVALGANLVEKTITKDRMTPSVEHVMSLEPKDMHNFVNLMRELPVALGVKRRYMSQKDLDKSMSMRRSIFLGLDLKAGDIISESHLEYRRPGFGMAPSIVDRVIGKALVNSVDKGSMLSWSDLNSNI